MSIVSDGTEYDQIKSLVDQCVCTNIRKAARAITRLYDEALNETGLRCTQLIILMVVRHMKNPTVTQLAGELVMDASTVARNLRPLEKQQLISMATGKDRRKRIISLTDKGVEQIELCLGSWNSVQEKIASSLPQEEFNKYMQGVSALSAVALAVYAFD